MKTKKCIWVVDDDDIYQFTIKLQIEMLFPNAEVISFVDGEEALKHAQSLVNFEEECPKAMFLDINMPIMDGWDFLREAKDFITPYADRVNIYMVSSSINPADITKANEHDLVTDYVTKPITDDSLKEIFESVDMS